MGKTWIKRSGQQDLQPGTSAEQSIKQNQYRGPIPSLSYHTCGIEPGGSFWKTAPGWQASHLFCDLSFHFLDWPKQKFYLVNLCFLLSLIFLNYDFKTKIIKIYWRSHSFIIEAFSINDYDPILANFLWYKVRIQLHSLVYGYVVVLAPFVNVIILIQ